MYRTAYLIADSPESHGVYDEGTETETLVRVSVSSVSARLGSNLGNIDYNNSLVFRLAGRKDYHGELRLKYAGDVYRVVQPYIRGDAIELTCEKVGSYAV